MSVCHQPKIGTRFESPLKYKLNGIERVKLDLVSTVSFDLFFLFFNSSFMVYITSFNKINIVQTEWFPQNVACESAVLCLDAQRPTLCLGVGHFLIFLQVEAWQTCQSCCQLSSASACRHGLILKNTHTHTHTCAELHMHTYFNLIFKTVQSRTRATNTNTFSATQATEARMIASLSITSYVNYLPWFPDCHSWSHTDLFVH